MQNQDRMIAPVNWAGNNMTMESWMGATSNVDRMIAHGMEGFTDLQDPLSIFGPSAFVPPPAPPPSSHNAI